ncbi:dimethyl sulfoxide reductase anchor subunit [bacterium]|nr:dimethyl sulfoxide reductase anchor subunit [bacterium]
MDLGSIGFDWRQLALFTTLTPAGAVATAFLALVLMTRPRQTRLAHALAAPLAVAWMGFVAAATHLGTPANALYTAAGVGRSPLSNEVATVVAFLFICGMCWLASFRRRQSAALDAIDRAGYVLCVASAMLAVTESAAAYGIATVPTWDVWQVPASLASGAVCAGSALAAGILRTLAPDATTGDGRPAGRVRAAIAACATASIALVAHALTLVSYACALADIGNEIAGSVGQAAQHWPAAVMACVALAGAGVATIWFALRPDHGTRRSRARHAAVCFAGVVAVFAGMLVARIAFYESYLSVGF